MKFLVPVLVSVLAFGSTALGAASPLPVPEGRSIRVAFVLSEGATMIDFAGPWEVFQDVHVPSRGHDMAAQMPFELYTVAASREPLRTSGIGGDNRPGGMLVTPDYTFADAPRPDVVVVPAQSGSDGMSEWLRAMRAEKAVLMSVCTGAFRLAEAGLLDGREATTHHGALQRLANRYPDIRVRQSVRYVEADPLLFTAGGLSSGIDLALHVVERYFGRDVAQATADEMEYQGGGWKTNAGAGQASVVTPTLAIGPDAVVSRWHGTLLPRYPETEPALPIVVHIAQAGDRHAAIVDSPAQGIEGEPLAIEVSGKRITLAANGGAARFSGTMSADAIVGEFADGGVTMPLTLTRSRE
jgi:putative intracellular protease/amidase